MEKIKTYLFAGFLDAGKTTYILDAIYHDFFHKHGRTLLLAFEQGQREYDAEKLREFQTDVVFYEAEGSKDITAFCLDSICQYHPDRIYVECNAMIDGLADRFPPCMSVAAKTAVIDGTTLGLYYNNMRQLLVNIVKDAKLVIFNRVPDRESLKPYGSAFRVMEPKAAYLWESRTGYHEKAFGNILTFDILADPIVLGEEDYLSFYLDVSDDPDKYAGKTVDFAAQIRDIGRETFRAGRIVMTCCMADLQYLNLECLKTDIPGMDTLSDGGWIRLEARCTAALGEYHRKKPVLQPVSIRPAGSVEKQILGL